VQENDPEAVRHSGYAKFPQTRYSYLSHSHAIDGPAGIELLMSAVLGVDLRKLYESVFCFLSTSGSEEAWVEM